LRDQRSHLAAIDRREPHDPSRRFYRGFQLLTQLVDILRRGEYEIRAIDAHVCLLYRPFPHTQHGTTARDRDK